MAVELRWVVPEGTTTERPRLQYRNWGEWPAAAGPWVDVPTVVVPQEPPKPAPTAAHVFGVPVHQEPEQQRRMREALEHCLNWLPEDCAAAIEARDVLATYGVGVAPHQTFSHQPPMSTLSKDER